LRGVKTLTQFGGVKIYGKKPFAQKGGVRHDPWPSHGVFRDFGQIDGYSGAIYLGPVFQLLDGNFFWYPTYKGATDVDVWNQWIYDWERPIYPDYQPHAGEAYNYIIRAKAFDKVLTTKMDDWRKTR
jgi:hypothetical protein